MPANDPTYGRAAVYSGGAALGNRAMEAVLRQHDRMAAALAAARRGTPRELHAVHVDHAGRLEAMRHPKTYPPYRDYRADELRAHALLMRAMGRGEAQGAAVDACAAALAAARELLAEPAAVIAATPPGLSSSA